jgi:hypothetical protein
MRIPTDDDLEILSGLCATGVRVAVVFVSGTMLQGNPMVPVIRVGFEGDVDVKLKEADSAEQICDAVLRCIRDVAVRKAETRAERLGDLGFQITRGLEGISL